VSQQPPPIPRVFSPPNYGDQVECDGRLYFLGALIGQGHFGAVYECTDEWGNRLVAKVLLPVRPYEEVRQVWLNEMTNLLHLRHPNVTYVYDAFVYRDTFYLVIERCATNLAAWPHVHGDVWIPYLARDVLQGLDFIHGRGYVHKDLHPGNVLVRPLGEPTAGGVPMVSFKIGDLGLSNLQGDLSRTMADWMLPPEHLDSERFGQIGPQTDIYHAGLLLLNRLLQTPRFFTNDEILAGVPSEIARSLPSAYNMAIAAALLPEVGKRTQTARDFWRAIMRAPALATG
jgi:serine/threonine-protein kinase